MIKNIIAIIALWLCAFAPRCEAQFVPDFEFYLYITDAMGNKDSVIFGYANNTNISFSDFGTEYTGTPFKDTLELRVTGWNNPSQSWKKGYDFLDCSPNSQTFGMGMAFSCMYPPMYFSWDSSLFQDDCRDHSILTVSQMYLQHPEFDDALHINMANQDMMELTLANVPWQQYSYPQTIYPDQTMQSGATDTLYFVFLAFAADSLTIGVSGQAGEAAAQRRIYPTATYDKVQVDIAEAQAPVLRLYDSRGVLLREERQNWQEISLNSLPAGLYLLEIEDKGQRSTHKIIKY